MDTEDTSAPKLESRGSAVADKAMSVLHKVLIAVVVLVIVVVGYFIAASIVPRWWGNSVGNWVDSSMSTGVGYGLAFGFVCTAVPIWLLIFAVKRVRNHPAIAAVSAFLALVVVVPNLLTASIAMGISSAANAGQRAMDVRAPGFRGATLTGVIVGAVVALALVIGFTVWHRRRAKNKALKAAQKQEAKAAQRAAEAEKRAARE